MIPDKILKDLQNRIIKLPSQLNEVGAALTKYVAQVGIAATGCSDESKNRILVELTRIEHVIFCLEKSETLASFESLITEAQNLLGTDDIPHLVVPGIEDEPFTLLLPPGQGPRELAIIFDGIKCCMALDCPGVVLHEAAHVNLHVDKHCSTGRSEKQKQGESMADALALAVGGSGFAAGFKSLIELSGRDPTMGSSTHPSPAQRATYLKWVARKAWDCNYLNEVTAHLTDLADSDGSSDWPSKMGGPHGHVSPVIDSVKIVPSEVEDERQGIGIAGPRVSLSAEHGVIV